MDKMLLRKCCEYLQQISRAANDWMMMKAPTKKLYYN